MSGVPVVLHGDQLRALVVGGGRVATRKSVSLLDSGAVVRVVARTISPELRARAGARLVLIERGYVAADIGDANVVFAATDSRSVNASVAADARAAGRLVNVTDLPADGNFMTAAPHRAGPLLVGVTAGIPRAATRIRDAVATHFDSRYALALESLNALRTRLLAEGRPDEWREAERALVGVDFCASVERGDASARIAQWR